MSPYRIGIVGARGIADYGGFETVVMELAPRLHEKGYAVYLSHRRGETSTTSEEYEGAKILYFPFRFPKSNKLGRIFEVIYDWYFVAFCSLVIRCNIIYCLGIASGPLLFLLKLSSSKAVLNLDGLEWRRAKFSLIERIYVRLAFLFSCVSADRLVVDNSQLMNYLPVRAQEKATFIPYGVASVACPAWDESAIPQYGRGAIAQILPSRYWLVVARLEPENNIHTIVQAYSKSRGEKPLLIVGSFSSTSYETYVRSLVDALPDGKTIIFAGSIYNQQHLSMLRCHCAAYLHGHSVGGTNPSLLEAMSARNLIVAHDNAFNREVCGDCARFFKDADELARLMSEIEDRPSSYAELGEKARARTMEVYRWPEVADAYDKLFRELLKAN